MSDDTTCPFLSISIMHEIANLSLPAFKLHIPFESSTGSIGITLSNIYTLVPLAIASLSKKEPSFT